MMWQKKIRQTTLETFKRGCCLKLWGGCQQAKQATTLLELMTVRAFHSKILRRVSLGTATGFQIRKGGLTYIPAILVFVAGKVHRQWLNHVQCLPAVLEGLEVYDVPYQYPFLSSKTLLGHYVPTTMIMTLAPLQHSPLLHRHHYQHNPILLSE